jgi:hypothetical protein
MSTTKVGRVAFYASMKGIGGYFASVLTRTAAHQTIHLGLCAALISRGIRANIELAVDSETCR